MKNASLAKSHSVTNEVQVDLDMLGALMLNGVTSEIGSTDVITIYNGGSGGRVFKLKEKLAQPTGPGDTICNTSIFRFGTGAGGGGLPLGGPGDEVGAEENTKPRSGLLCVRAPRPINISVRDEICGGGLV